MAERPTTLLPLDLLAEVFPGVEHLAGRVAPRTLTEYRRDAQHYLAFCAWDVERAHHPHNLRAWCSYMVDHTTFSPHTINRRLISVKALITASAAIDRFDEGVAYRFGLVERVKVSSLRHRLKPHGRVRLEPDEVRRLCRQADPTTLIGLRDRAMLHVLASSGCRISEVVTLRQSGLLRQGDHSMIEVLGKGQAEPRRAPLSLEAAQWIERWLRARDVASPWIFTRCGRGDERRQGITPHTAWRRVRLYARQAGLVHVKPHDLRRFLATTLTARYSLRDAQVALGHASPQTTAGYVMDELKGGLGEGLF